MKPNIKKDNDNKDFWRCEGGGCWALYPTIKQAYIEWLDVYLEFKLSSLQEELMALIKND